MLSSINKVFPRLNVLVLLYVLGFILVASSASSQQKIPSPYFNRFVVKTDEEALNFIEKARLLSYLEEYDSTLYFLEKAKPLTVDSAILSRCFRLESQTYFHLNAFGNSERAANRALQLLPALHDLNEDWLIHNVLGSIQAFTGNYDTAFYHYNACLDFGEKVRDKSLIANALANLGFLYYKMFDYKSAQNFGPVH